MARALVTGATGLVGSALAERLVADGWDVRALVREPATARWLEAAGVTLHRGDILERDALGAAASGCGVIFHAAAALTPRGGWEAYRVPNVDGTRNVVWATQRAGARLLHVSSVAVYGNDARYRERLTDETTPLGPLPEDAWYARSKREAEELILAAHARGEVWATAVRPCVVYGRRDRQLVPRTARMLRFGIGPLIGGGRTTMALVHAANVADAAVRAVAFDGAGGLVYNTTNDDEVTVREFLRLAGEGLGRRVVLLPVPYGVARAGLHVVRGVTAMTMGRGAGVMAGATLNFLTRDNPFSSERAYRELGWSPPIVHRVGLPDAFRHWREQRA